MKKNVIVSLADANYFDLLNELIDSIKSFEKSKDIAVCILDAGLSEQQKDILADTRTELLAEVGTYPTTRPANFWQKYVLKQPVA